MDPKKQHEVESLARCIDEVGRSSRASFILDVGAGQGYLSNRLCTEFGWRVVAVESKVHNIARATERSQKKPRVDVANPCGNAEPAAVETAPTDRDHSDSSNAGLSGVVANVDGNSTLDDLVPPALLAEAERGCLMVGLHCCGDLTPTMLRLASADRRVKALVVVGCCYNHCSERDAAGGAAAGFPMSTLLVDARLGWGARMLACQNSGEADAQSRAHSFRMLKFRAVLQVCGM